MDEPLINGETTIDTGELVLHHAPSTALPGNEDGSTDYPKITNFYEAKAICWLETQKLWAIAGPIAFNILCVYGINSVTQIFVGHIGDVELSAIAIAMSVISNFSFGFLLGMGSALETLCGQAFGAGQIFMLGVYMQRSWIILIVTCIILSPIYIFSAPVLKLLGQEEDIAELAGRFAIQIIPQMFSLAINFPTQKFLQSQSKVSVLAYIGAFALVLHIILLWLFIYVFGWGIGGAAFAYDISGWIIALLQVGYVVRWCTDGWTGLSMLAFNEIWAFVRLSLASAVMLCLEVWYMMVLVVLTGHLKNAVIAVGSISICMNINGWEAMLFIGINAAISVRVSNELGSGHPRAAKYSVLVVILESLLIGIFFMILILVTKDDFSIIFTSSKDLQNAVSKLAPLLGVTMVLNSVQPVISGVAVGGGWQALVAYINLGCYYVFGLPLGFLLGYVLKWGVQGIWIGMLWGTALQTGVLLVIIWKTNWNKEASQASERVRMWGGVD
ncbi:Protein DETOXIFICATION 34 [Ranunculus cassubicifolius]